MGNFCFPFCAFVNFQIFYNAFLLINKLNKNKHTSFLPAVAGQGLGAGLGDRMTRMPLSSERALLRRQTAVHGGVRGGAPFPGPLAQFLCWVSLQGCSANRALPMQEDPYPGAHSNSLEARPSGWEC